MKIHSLIFMKGSVLIKKKLIHLWNFFFGKTIFAIYLDNKLSKRRRKKASSKLNKKTALLSNRRYVPTNDLTVIDLDHDTNALDVDLVDDNIDDVDKTELRQYTKKLVSKITNFAIIWISWSYVLASYAVFKYGEFNPLESLSETVGTTLLGVVITYGFKALLETFLKKRNEFNLKKLEAEAQEKINNITPTINCNDTEIESEEAVG